MKILHINGHLNFQGGIETYLLSLIPRLEELEHSQVVAFSEGNAALAPHAHQIQGLSDFGAKAEKSGYAEFSRLLDAEKPDVVHLHNIHNIGPIRACLDAVPTVVTAHDYRYVCPASNFYFRRSAEVCPSSCGPQCFANAVVKRCLTPRPSIAWNYYRRVKWIAANSHRFARVIAPSSYAASRYVQAGFTTDRVKVLPYFCPIIPEAAPRPSPDQQNIVFLGRLSENKGVRYFIEALGLLPETVRGLVVGNLNSARSEELQSLATQSNCHGRLEMRAWAGRDEIRSILKNASLLVFPSIWAETLGIVGLEALACGVPVVASDIGGVREWLQHGENGLLVPPKDKHAMAGAILEILENPQRAQRMGERGIALVKSKFSVERHLDGLVDIYTNVCGQEKDEIAKSMTIELEHRVSDAV